mgnify:CR=1 FL=1
MQYSHFVNLIIKLFLKDPVSGEENASGSKLVGISARSFHCFKSAYATLTPHAARRFAILTAFPFASLSKPRYTRGLYSTIFLTYFDSLDKTEPSSGIEFSILSASKTPSVRTIGKEKLISNSLKIISFLLTLGIKYRNLTSS